MPDGAAFTRAPNALAAHYTRFRVHERLLLTGHSHQAWPDVGFEGQMAAWTDAAELVDEKWERAFAKAERVRTGFAELLGCPADEIALAGSTHDLVVRLLSGLDLRRRPRLVTTDGEFHTIRRQLDRLAEEKIEVVKIPAEPVDTLAERVAAVVDGRTAAALVSAVLYATGRIVPNLEVVVRRCAASGAAPLVDAYHALNAIPFTLAAHRLGEAFVVGGGYKYCQLGEGNCFLRVPPGWELRPVVTGWFSEFATLADAPGAGVRYGVGPARLAGATYDPTSHYRAAAVLDFFADRELTPTVLRAVSRAQVGLLAERFDALDLDAAVVRRDRATPLERIGGFLALESPVAGALARGLRVRGVHTDFRGSLLRLGPAPYLSDAQLDAAMTALGEVARAARPA